MDALVDREPAEDVARRDTKKDHTSSHSQNNIPGLQADLREPTVEKEQ